MLVDCFCTQLWFKFEIKFGLFCSRIITLKSDKVWVLSHCSMRDKKLSACPAYSGLADFGLEKTLPLYFVDEKHLVGI